MSSIQVLHGKDLGPKWFSLGLILLISFLPASILSVNIIQKFYFQPDYYYLFSTPRKAYLLFIIGYLIIFLIIAIILYMIYSKFTFRLVLVNGFLCALAILLIFQSFKTHSYLIEDGLKIKEPFANEESFEWNDIQKVTQINKYGTPFQLEFQIVEGKTYVFNLQGDFFAKRKAFYQLLTERNIKIDFKEKE